MSINLKKINVFLSTLNFVLFFVGFQLVTSLFLPSSTEQDGLVRSVTVPYRALTLIVSVIVFLLNIKNVYRSYPFPFLLFLLYWIILISRAFYDIFLRDDIRLDDTSQIWFYIFGICLPAIISLTKSLKFVNLNYSFWAILILISFSLTLTLFSNKALLFLDESIERPDGNAAISTIAMGHFGGSAIIIAIYTLINKKLNKFCKFLVCLLIVIGFFSMLRAGSRGPVLALIVVLLFWIFSSIKNKFFAFFILSLLFLILILIINYLLLMVGQISPVIEQRLRESIYEGSTGGRDPYYTEALNAFYDNPIFGKQFLIIFPNGKYDYAHNLVLDTLMGMGIIGGFILLWFLFSSIKRAYHLICNRDENYWIVLFLIQEIIANMVSNAFYYNQLLSVLFVFVFLYSKKLNQINDLRLPIMKNI